MRAILLNSVTHGALTLAVFMALAIWRSDMRFGFVAAMLLSAIAAWFRPCYQQFVFGALLALMLASLISFVFIEGSAAIIMLPTIAIVMASAVFFGFVIGRILKRMLIRFW
ncbi:hypothetical protein [Undibacterium sp.]|uniref:hypothetical protein n=1 Tax=Undibacterium sp. TaxID=1914977 RepID=UPI003751F051